MPNKLNPESTRKSLLQSISETAKEKGITQEMLSEKTGFCQSNISRILAGKYPPTLDSFLKLCEAVGVKIKLVDKK